MNHGYRSKYGAGFYGTERRAERRNEALQRNRNWQSLSLADQVAELDKRLGKGLGAQKQREKINQLIIAGNTHNPKKEKDNVKHDRKSSPRDAKGTQGAPLATRETSSREQQGNQMVR